MYVPVHCDQAYVSIDSRKLISRLLLVLEVACSIVNKRFTIVQAEA